MVPNSASERAIRFNYLQKLFSEDNRETLQSFIDGNMKGPAIIDLDPTTACNFGCPECISANLLNKEKISAERLAGLMTEFKAAGVKAIVMIGGGEPLAHRCMPDPIVQAHALGMAVGLTTNGSLIERHLDAIAECVSWTRVSMDAGTPATFDSVRPSRYNDAFDRIVRGMTMLAERKQGALGYSFLVIQRFQDGKHWTNASEIYEAARIAKEIGCDYFECKPMFDMGHFLLPMEIDVGSIVREQLQRCDELVDDNFSVVAPASMRHIELNPDPVQHKTYHNCAVTEFRTVVTPSGMYPCAYHRGNSKVRLGDVPTEPFDQYWRSEERRAASAKVDPARDCSFFCARHGLNVTLNALKSAKSDGVDLLEHIAPTPVKDPFF